jgi:hypothetical protein
MNIDIEKLKAYLDTKTFLTPRSLLNKLNDAEFVSTLQPDRVPVKEITVPTSQRVRTRSADTSWDAALSITNERGRRAFERIYGILDTLGPLTDSEISTAYATMYNDPISPSGLRSRRAELAAAGWVRTTGDKRKNHRNRDEQVWEALPEM